MKTTVVIHATYIDFFHLILFIHTLYLETTLIDVVIQTRVLLYYQPFWKTQDSENMQYNGTNRRKASAVNLGVCIFSYELMLFPNTNLIYKILCMSVFLSVCLSTSCWLTFDGGDVIPNKDGDVNSSDRNISFHSLQKRCSLLLCTKWERLSIRVWRRLPRSRQWFQDLKLGTVWFVMFDQKCDFFLVSS